MLTSFRGRFPPPYSMTFLKFFSFFRAAALFKGQRTPRRPPLFPNRIKLRLSAFGICFRPPSLFSFHHETNRFQSGPVLCRGIDVGSLAGICAFLNPLSLWERRTSPLPFLSISARNECTNPNALPPVLQFPSIPARVSLASPLDVRESTRKAALCHFPPTTPVESFFDPSELGGD